MPIEFSGQKKIIAWAFILATLLLAFMIRGFLIPFVLAVILVALTHGLHERITRMFRGRKMPAALLMVLLTALIVLGPIAAILTIAALQAQQLATQIDPRALMDQGNAVIGRLHLDDQLARFQVSGQQLLQGASAAGQKILGWAVSGGLRLGAGIVGALIYFALTLLCMFYLYIDGEKLHLRVLRLIPLPNPAAQGLLTRYLRVARATIRGNFAVGALQGTLGGILFALVGIPSPVFFGVLMALGSLIPSVGAALIWFPAGLILLLMGSFVKGIIVLAAGALVVSTADNLVRPILVGRDSGMHDLMILLTTLGGIFLFGPIGILFGPVVGAFFLSVLELYEDVFVDGKPL